MTSLTNDEIIEVRDALLHKEHAAPLTALEKNLLRDCDIALGLARCSPESREEARWRATRLAADRRALAEFERTSGGAPPWSNR